MYIKRHIEKYILESKDSYPVVLVTGPRQVGKSTVLKTLFSDHEYETLDDVSMLRAISSDPLGYLMIKGTPFVIDEVQKAPALFSSIKYVVDKNGGNGLYFLTGSQKFPLMQGDSESLSGRIAVVDLLGLSMREIYGDGFDLPFMPTPEYLSARRPKNPLDQKALWKIVHRGSMPALYADDRKRWEPYYSNYVSTYVERDVRSIVNVGDQLTFMQFLVSLAARSGEILNMNSIAKDVGVSLPTVKRWISALLTSNIIYLLQPLYANAVKRVIRSPKLYFTDTGLACYLCRWLSPETLENGAQAGAMFETFVVSEILKSYYNVGSTPDIYFYRDREGNEIDLVIRRDGKLFPVEIKKTASPNVKDVKAFDSLKKAFPDAIVSDGGVVCSCSQLLPLGENVKTIPVNYI